MRLLPPRPVFPALLLATLAVTRLAVAGNLETTVDNDTDLFVPGAATTDRNYTQGTRIMWFATPGAHPRWVDAVATRLGADAGDAPARLALGIGQEIHTPDAISRRVPLAGDRPYAGWLYGTAAIATASAQRERTLELRAGMVGPSSFAAQAQQWWHRELGIRAPRGWAHQLRDEPGIQLALEERRRVPVVRGRLDLVPHARVTVGNVQTHAAAGTTLRVGLPLPADFGPSSTAPLRPHATGSRRTLYAFARAEGRAVARDITLDGNSLGGGPRVTREPFVGEAQLGVGMSVGGFAVRYAFSYTTHQFRERHDAHRYGSVRFGLL
jgi:hypothetical protein